MQPQQLQQQQQQHGALRKSNSITSSMVVNSMGNTNDAAIDTGMTIEGFDVEGKNSVTTFDGTAIYDVSNGDGNDDSKDMYLKFLLNKDQNRTTKVMM